MIIENIDYIDKILRITSYVFLGATPFIMVVDMMLSQDIDDTMDNRGYIYFLLFLSGIGTFFYRPIIIFGISLILLISIIILINKTHVKIRIFKIAVLSVLLIISTIFSFKIFNGYIFYKELNTKAFAHLFERRYEKFDSIIYSGNKIQHKLLIRSLEKKKELIYADSLIVNHMLNIDFKSLSNQKLKDKVQDILEPYSYHYYIRDFVISIIPKVKSVIPINVYNSIEFGNIEEGRLLIIINDEIEYINGLTYENYKKTMALKEPQFIQKSIDSVRYILYRTTTSEFEFLYSEGSKAYRTDYNCYVVDLTNMSLIGYKKIIGPPPPSKAKKHTISTISVSGAGPDYEYREWLKSHLIRKSSFTKLR